MLFYYRFWYNVELEWCIYMDCPEYWFHECLAFSNVLAVSGFWLGRFQRAPKTLKICAFVPFLCYLQLKTGFQKFSLESPWKYSLRIAYSGFTLVEKRFEAILSNMRLHSIWLQVIAGGLLGIVTSSLGHLMIIMTRSWTMCWSRSSR